MPYTKETLHLLPDKPGVYLMRGALGSIIYIGKAKSLKKRVRSYFQKKQHDSLKTQLLIQEIEVLDIVLLKSENEALIIESQLIKEFKPKFNILLKDDKQYPYLKIHSQLSIPRLEITRLKKDDGAQYFGPYSDVRLLRQTIDLLERTFKIRPCLIPEPNSKDYHRCLYSMIQRCSAPCRENKSLWEYQTAIKNIQNILLGHSKKILISLNQKMKKASQNLQYEQAANYRDTLHSLSKLLGTQKPRVQKFKRLSQSNIIEIKELQTALQLEVSPQTIEAFDISNFQGKEAVGSMICFKNGNPNKRFYRRFKIKTVHQINDFAMMQEVVYRRYHRLIKENTQFPDLILIDGGLGQLHAAHKSLALLNLNIPIMGLAKKYEEIYILNKSEPIRLAKNSPALFLIQRIRDEAHRFAVTFHQLLRDKKIKTSAIHDIPGIGPHKAIVLLQHLGSLHKIKTSSIKTLQKIPGIGPKQANLIYHYFH